MRNILLCCLSVALIIFMIPSAFAVDIDSSNNFDINIETLDQTSTITEIAVTFLDIFISPIGFVIDFFPGILKFSLRLFF